MELDVRENDLQLLIARALKTSFGMSQDTVFYEIPVGSSRADILYVQVPKLHETILPPGTHVFELKMKREKQRLLKQVSDYRRAVDYVWIVGVNRVIECGDESVGIVSFDTSSCAVTAFRPASFNGDSLDLGMRQELLSCLTDRLRSRHREVADMARTNKGKTNRIMIQKKLC